MKIKLPLFLLLFCTGLALAQPTLYAVDSSRSFYKIDMATGARTTLGTVAAAAGTTAGLAYDKINNILYLTSSGNDALYTLDRTTFAVTLVGSYGDSNIVMHGLEYNDASGKLYGMSSHNAGLYEINKNTGAATLIGTTGLSSFCNLGWDSTNNTMYMTNSGNDSFYSINLVTGAATLIGALSGPANPNGLAYDYNLDRLFLIDNNTDNLYTINRATGLATVIGSAGAGNYLGLVYINETLGTNDWEAGNVLIYQQNQQIVIASETDIISSAEVYDLAGRKLYHSNNINDTHLEIASSQFGKQLLVVKVQTETGKTITKKIIN